MRITYSIYELGLMIAFVSFLGFIVENIWIGLVHGYFDNWNMRLPFLLGYGLFIAALYILSASRRCAGTRVKTSCGKRKYPDIGLRSSNKYY